MSDVRLARLEDRLAELEAIFRTTNEMVVDHEARFVREEQEESLVADEQAKKRLNDLRDEIAATANEVRSTQVQRTLDLMGRLCGILLAAAEQGER